MKKKLMTLQQHRLLKEAGQLIAFSERLKHVQKETTDRNREEREEKRRRSAKAASTVTALSGDIEEFLTSRYDFRYNLLTDETEFRPAGQRTATFTPVGKRELNTFCIEAHAEGIPCWDKDLNRYVYSTYIPAYHPFLLYMDELPDWDGKDRLTALACRVSSRPHWVRGFHTWMLGLASQWMGVSGLHANSVAPVLVSREQGRRKSSFCRALMPDVLARYYTDNLKLTSQGQAERMLAEMGMLNMDEFDKYADNKMPLLKNLMQMSVLNIRKAYQQNFRQLPRIASFIGTSNRFDLLTDPTGSRRFLCIEVKHDIDCTGIEHDQIFAQLKAELIAGRRNWFTKPEEEELQWHNEAFYRVSLAEEAVRSLFRAPLPAEKSIDLTAADIFDELQKTHPALMRGSNPMQFGSVLLRVGLKRRHTKYGNVYEVVRRKKEVSPERVER